MNRWVIVAAAGKGTRAARGENKVFSLIGGRSVLSLCMDALHGSGLYDGAILILSDADRAAYAKLCAAEGENQLVKRIVSGGSTRQKSVRNGLLALPRDTEIVSIHDAARPFVTQSIIRATLDSAEEWGSGVISTPPVDTIVRRDEQRIHTLDRSALRAVQTPQSFRFEQILRAHESAARDGFEATDDAALYEKYIGGVRLVESADAAKNVKLTTREDFMRFDDSPPRVRMGIGYDVHRLKEGRALILCGIDIAHERGLDGHSDADVAAHALMDAILGALGEGDIGRHFPDTDPAYAGISSMRLLGAVADLMERRGYRIGNADVTIVAQRPKLAPYMPAMRAGIAAALRAPIERINVKATTTERLGFEGEELGISSQAVALLEKRQEEAK